MALRLVVRWNAGAGRRMAWVRFPDGTRKKVERVEKADAQRDLDDLVELRSQVLKSDARHVRQPTFNEVIDEWFAAGYSNVTPTKASRHARVKPANTLANARQLLGASIRPVIGAQRVDRTTTERLELDSGDAPMAVVPGMTSVARVRQPWRSAIRHRRPSTSSSGGPTPRNASRGMRR